MTTENEMPEEVFPPRFVYVTVEDDCFAVEIDGYEDRDKLVALKGNREALLKWLSDNWDQDDDLPAQDEIINVAVEIHDIESDALAGGNDTVELWAPDANG